jgi:rod shape-determining protein MreD
MKRIGLLLFFGVLFITLQSTLLMCLPIQRIRPDIVLVFTFYLGLAYPPISGGIFAFFLGCLMDLFSGNTFGLYTFSRPLIFYVAHFFRNRFYLEGFPFKFLFVFSFALLEGLLILVLLAGLNPIPVGKLYSSFFTLLLPQSIFTGLITPILFPLFEQGSALLSRKNRAGATERG